MTNTFNSSSSPYKNEFNPYQHGNASTHPACKGSLQINSAIYRVEVMLRGRPSNQNCWETFIFTKFELAARFIQSVDIVKSKIFFEPKQCSNASRRMYPISNVLAYVDVSGRTFHVFVCGKNCADEDDVCCTFGALPARPKRFT